MKVDKMVTIEEVEKVWGNADFGPNISKMEVVKYGLLKCAGQWYQGYTSKSILYELGLITKKYTLSKRGARCLYEFFKQKCECCGCEEAADYIDSMDYYMCENCVNDDIT